MRGIKKKEVAFECKIVLSINLTFLTPSVSVQAHVHTNTHTHTHRHAHTPTNKGAEGHLSFLMVQIWENNEGFVIFHRSPLTLPRSRDHHSCV